MKNIRYFAITIAFLTIFIAVCSGCRNFDSTNNNYNELDNECNKEVEIEPEETQPPEEEDFSIIYGSEGYASLSMDKVKDLTSQLENYIFIDVRTPEEFAQGHLPSAINIPNETIDENLIEQLTDKNQYLLVYCRSGRRSKEAALKLVDLGYVNVIEIGGILDWTGELE